MPLTAGLAAAVAFVLAASVVVVAGVAGVVEAAFETSGVGEGLADAICARTAVAGTRQRAQRRTAFLKVFIIFSGDFKGRSGAALLSPPPRNLLAGE
jgi:hypothetical protein